MPQVDRKLAPGSAPPIYLDIVRRYTGARLRSALGGVDAAPLPTQQVELLLRLIQRERERRA